MLNTCALIGVGALWGLTNPIIKKNSVAIKEIKANSAITQFCLEIKYLLTHLGYIAPLIVNQLGSVLYFLTLQNVDLTLSVPLANSLTFIFTAVAGSYLEEKLPTKKVVAGSAFILFGTILCCYDKQLTDHL
ncbi:transmembrane protein 234 homolog [Euwallacea fornicatus]|uniref:transmembrane protein 234 homolog n=1 Tax=Euwallacea fornicatus TaxID=995702 RepID=UPI00338FDAB2